MASNRNEYQEYFLGGGGCKSDWCLGLTTLPSSCADCLEIWEPQPPGTVSACNSPVQGLLLKSFCYITDIIKYPFVLGFVICSVIFFYDSDNRDIRFQSRDCSIFFSVQFCLRSNSDIFSSVPPGYFAEWCVLRARKVTVFVNYQY